MLNKWLNGIALAICMILVFASCKEHDCSSHTASSSTAVKIDESGPEYTSKYVCPMHCKGSGSEEPGECPVCRMDYVKKKKKKHKCNHPGHNHDHDHDHDHHH